MIYEVEVSEQADSDLRGIFEYIAFLRVMYAGRDIDNQLNLYTKQSSLFLLNIQTWYFARFFCWLECNRMLLEMRD